MTQQVIAQVILYNEAGSSLTENMDPITAEDVSQYRVSIEVIEAAARELQALGFEVVSKGSVSLTISAEKTKFEEIFATSVQSQELSEATEVPRYGLVKPPRIPETLSALVEDVVLPDPPQLF